jgi:hypothetical protein
MIEVIIAVAIAATMLGIVISMIHTLLGAERRVANAIAHQDTLDRLSVEFRRDVHRAEQAQVKQEQLELIDSDGQRVIYTGVTGGVRRRQIESGRDTGRKMYRLRPGTQTRFAVLDEASRVRCEVSRGVNTPASQAAMAVDGGHRQEGQTQQTAVRVIVFESWLGRGRRFDSK